MKNKWMVFILVLVVLLTVSGCTTTHTKSNNQSVESNTDLESDTDSTQTTVDKTDSDNTNIPKEYLNRLNEGWKLPSHADLQETLWSWSGKNDKGRQVSYHLTFHEWTVDVRWNDGIDENDYEYLDAAYELIYQDGIAIMKIDFREMAGKLYFDILLSSESDMLYTLADAYQGAEIISWEPLCRELKKDK